MTEAIQTAFKIFAVGMTTVFAILSLVVLTGNALIFLTNKFVDENVPQRTPISPQKQVIERKKLVAIAAAVSAMTDGKGVIEEIKKVS